MEDTITPNISIALYRYLCQHIVGSEDHVKTIRLMNAVRDNVISNTIFTVITSGSFGEGLEMRGSDLDTMFVFKCFQVFENGYPHINQYKTYFSLDRDDVKPGFTQLRLEYISDQKKMESYEKYNGRYYLSNATFKQQFVSDLANKIHGPCISDKNGLTDNACCIHCKTWVSPAVQWITRIVLGSALVESHIFIYRNGMAQNVFCQQSSIKYIYAYFMSKWCNENAQVKQVDHTIRNNKYQYNQYNQYKYCLCTLLTNIYHDAISGWLMVASLFYKTKQYVKALRIIVYSLSKCTQEKLYRGMTMSDIHYQLLKQPSSHKKSLIYLQKEMFVDYIEFNMKSTLIPDELKTVNSNSKHCYPSTAYAHFLKFLCHYHLNDVRQCQDSLISLELVIEENFLIADMVSKARANTLFRIALQLFGD
ncbi:unnamed protein product [Mytilus coruscus]|uniref:Uncharacterized protein n=1 Tax=Mytilus coruscus TaxID=42192 RepID=A0A6J8DGX0_MYTCO|nr:unnamed protein product [Mytilus coruscus]